MAALTSHMWQARDQKSRRVSRPRESRVVQACPGSNNDTSPPCAFAIERTRLCKISHVFLYTFSLLALRA
jgi:hypothetical protein